LLYARDHLLVRCRDDQVVTKRTYASAIATAILSTVILFPFIAKAAEGIQEFDLSEFNSFYTPEPTPEPTLDPTLEPTPESTTNGTSEPEASPLPSESLGVDDQDAPSTQQPETSESPTPDASAEPTPTPTPTPTPEPANIGWLIGDQPRSDIPAREIQLPKNQNNPVPVVNEGGAYNGPAAYTVIGGGVALGNFIFDPVASRQLLEMMRAPDCNLGPICGAIIIPSDGTINPGTNVVIQP